MKKLLLLLLLLPSICFADGLKVSQMSQKTTAGDYDLLYLVDNDEGGALSKSITFSNLRKAVISGISLTTNDLTVSTNRNFVTDAQLAIILNTSGINTGNQDLSGYELLSNKVTSISGSSTDMQYPSAKLLYDQLVGKQASGSYLTMDGTVTGATSQAQEFTNGITTTATGTFGDLITKSPFADVRAFGAIGDGSTDDTTAIQSTLNNGKSIFIPSGNFLITGTLTIPSNTLIFGMGIGVSKITKNGTGSAFDLGGNSYITFRDLEIAGGTGGNATSHGIVGSSASTVVLDNIYIHDIVGSLISLTNPVGITIQESKVTGSSGDGIVLTNGTTVTIQNTYINANGGNGLTVSSTPNIRLIGNIFEENTGHGVVINTYGSLIAGNETEANTGGSAFQITGYGNEISGNTISDASVGIAFISGSANTISGNSFGSMATSISFDASSNNNFLGANDRNGGSAVAVTDNGSANWGRRGSIFYVKDVNGYILSHYNNSDNGLYINATGDATEGARIRLRNAADNDVGNVLNIDQVSTTQPMQFWTNRAVRQVINSSGNVDFKSGNLLTSGTLGAGATQVSSIGINQAPTATSKISVSGLPTSSSGLATGDLWVDTTSGLNILKVK